MIMRLLLGLFIGWLTMRVGRHFVSAMVEKRVDDAKINKKENTLELVACPRCGTYTTAPCTNPDCLKI